ncbi:MAG: glycosyltransferase family 4 protein [bacterium]|nr:glycosyltransferase family 4 protein [bacterium]
MTWALHRLVKQWNDRENVNVLVVRPVYIYLSELMGLKKGQKQSLKKRVISIDGVPVLVCPVYKIPKIAYFYFSLYRYLNRYLKSAGFQPDIVVAHYDKSLHIGHRYARRRGLPFSAGLHITPDLMEENKDAFFLRCGPLLEDAALIACRSGYIYNKIQQWFPMHKEKSFIAFSGIEASLIEPPGAAVDRMKQWKEHPRQIEIVTVSSLIERKNIDTVLEALAQLPETVDWNYTVIGEGDQRTHLETLSKELGIGHRVKFPGTMPRHRVMETLKQSHIFVMVSHLETFGLAYLEAMAAGNLVIGSRGEGIDGVIRHKQNGFLCPAGETEPLKKIIAEILLRMTANQLESILKKAYQTITQYTDEKAAQNYLERLMRI